ncbi:HAD-IA family hydrolase [Candidatus Uhrbacteria bacterium]|nr:HAD-IA family hydrolase [Candidatus Uhrbacteria bacterium]
MSDLGNVVAGFKTQRYTDCYADIPSVRRHLNGDREAAEGLEEKIRDVHRRVEIGLLTEPEFRREISCCLGLRRTISWKEMYRRFYGIFTLNEPIRYLWERLRRSGLVLVAVSNVCPGQEEGMRRIGALAPFDHLVMSYREGIVKPSTELMVRALDRAGAAAEEAVFIDDTEKNLDPAIELGIRTHCFRGFTGLLAFLVDCGLVS